MNTSASPQPKLARRSSRLVMLWTAIGVLLALIIAYSSIITPTGADSPQCRSIYMYPSYAHLTGLDSTHTKFSTKYNLFLYREQGKDTVPDTTQGHGEFSGLDGIPVLFIPGNAGSFKQVRSIAAEAATLFDQHRDEPQWKGKNMDFFAAHFNEDFTAFHGRTMLDQAEYLNDAIKFILSLYAEQENAPKSIIVIGHSMGGVVSRVMLTLPNYVEGSVNTIITLAAPHAAAPATFDGDIMRIYAATDKFWRAGFTEGTKNTVAKRRLHDVSLISITGGLSDTILPADYTTLRGIVPDEHGFTVYTTGIPGVWTPIDHLAIVWCDQFRKVVASTLFDIVDPFSSTKTKPLTDRMRIFRRDLLSGLEPQARKDFVNVSGDTPVITMALLNDNIIIEGTGTSNTWNDDSKFHAFPLNDKPDSDFAYLSTTRPHAFDPAGQHSSLLLCNIAAEQSTLDSTDFECVDAAADVYKVPNPNGPLQESSIGGSLQPLYAASIPSSLLRDYSFVIYQPAVFFDKDDFTYISVSHSKRSSINATTSAFDLLFGTTLSLSKPDIYTRITFNNVWSSLFAYTIKVEHVSKDLRFPPMAAQLISDPMEVKWHVNLEGAQHVSFHSIAPYTPYSTLSNPLSFALFTPPGTTSATVTFRFDIMKSLKLLVLRYRLAVASIPTFIILLTMICQFYTFYTTNQFPAFEEGLSTIANKSALIMAGLALLVPLTCSSFLRRMFFALDPIALTNPSDLSGAHVNPYYLGLQDKSAWFLGPLFYLISFAAVVIVLFVVRAILLIIPLAITMMTSLSHIKVTGLRDIAVIQGVHDLATGSMKDMRRLTGSLVLAMFVMFYIPYQFAYVVCCLVQGATTIKAYISSENSHKEKIDPRKKSIANFNLSVLMLMLWIIPVNAPVLVVFFHNMAVRWKTPFTSHHNILAILPIIVLVGRNVQGDYLPTAHLTIQKKLTYFILGYFAFFTLVYGVRHLYWLHYLLNFFAAWLMLLSLWKANSGV